MRILAIHDGGSGCTYYRMLMPLREVAKHGHEVVFRASGPASAIEMDPEFTWDDVPGFDIVIGQRFNSVDGVLDWRALFDDKRRLVYENDDDVFSIDPENSAAYEVYQDEVVRESVRTYCRHSDLITTTSETLAKVHRSFAETPVAVLPNCVPEFVLDLPRTQHKRLRVGWVGGGSHTKDIQFIAPSVSRFFQKNPGCDLYLGGSDYRNYFKLSEDRMFHGAWRHITDSPGAYYQGIDFDIGLCPLFGTKFDQSKSYIKALEYAARGIPVVASDVAPYREFVRHGETGFLAKYDHEWVKYLYLLASDSGLREKMGAAAKEEARKHTIEGNWSKWTDAYRSLL